MNFVLMIEKIDKTYVICTAEKLTTKISVKLKTANFGLNI